MKGWFDEYDSDPDYSKRGDDDTSTIHRAPSLIRVGSEIHNSTNLNVPNVVLTRQRDRMNHFESLDYWDKGGGGMDEDETIQNSASNNVLSSGLKVWLYITAIGFAVGAWTVFMDETITFLLDIRQDYILLHPLRNYGVFEAFLVYAAFSVGLVALSTTICHRMPQAAGSGLPEIRAYLNGVFLPHMFAFQTMVVKTASCIFAVAGGLPAGPEGPIIHIGAMIGAGLPRLKSKKLIKNPRVQRDFITAGCAAGVTAAFGAPIGGLLFVLEEMSSFFSIRLAWMLFLCCLLCNFVMNVVTTHWKGWRGTSHHATTTNMWEIAPDAVELVRIDTVEPMNVLLIPLSIVLGGLCGVLGAGFSRGNVFVIRTIRNPLLNRSAFLRCLEPCVVSCLFAAITFFLPFAFECQPIPADITKSVHWAVNGTYQLTDIVCSNSGDITNTTAVYNPMASLSYARWVESLHMLLARGPTTFFPGSVLVTWFIVYTTFTMYCQGMYLSIGLLIPIMIVGALFGNLFGVTMTAIFGSSTVIDNGLMAMIGMAGFFGSVTRLTFSLCVMILEMSHDVQHLMCIITSVFVAKTVADYLSDPLDLSILQLKCVPFLTWETSGLALESYVARDVMYGPLTVFHGAETASTLLDILTSQPHNCYPVVDGSRLIGVVNRQHVRLLLWHVYFRHTREGDRNTTLTVRRLNAIDDVLISTRHSYSDLPPAHIMELEVTPVPLTIVMNRSPFVVHEQFGLYETYCMFRSLGLRHLLVVSDTHAATGIITRKELVGSILTSRLLQMQQVVAAATPTESV